MTHNPEKPLDELRRASEEEFFRKQNQELAKKLKTKMGMAAEGVRDEALIKDLLSAGFDEDSVRVLFLVPIIEIALADGRIEEDEKAEILRIVKTRGISEQSAAYKTLLSWLKNGSTDASFVRAKTLIDPLIAEERKNDQSVSWILAGAQSVAKAAGGLLGLGIGSKISAEEEKLIQKLSQKLKR